MEAPVLPVLVALDWQEASPVKPEKALGVTVRSGAAGAAVGLPRWPPSEPPAAVVAPARRRR